MFSPRTFQSMNKKTQVDGTKGNLIKQNIYRIRQPNDVYLVDLTKVFVKGRRMDPVKILNNEIFMQIISIAI